MGSGSTVKAAWIGGEKSEVSGPGQLSGPEGGIGVSMKFHTFFFPFETEAPVAQAGLELPN